MSTATLTEKGQITIPRLIRKVLGLSPHQKILFVPKRESVELIPIRGDLMGLYGSLHTPRTKKVSDWQRVRSQVRHRTVARRVRGS